jgi:hypothetical protein
MARKGYILICAVLVTCTLSVYSSHAQKKAGLLSNKDKTIIIRSILKREDLRNRDLASDERAEALNISTENISTTPLPKIEGLTFVRLRPAEIRQRVQNGFLYYKFGRFTIRGNRIRATFGHYFENVQGQASYSGGLVYEYRKVGRKWVGIEVSGWGYIS